MKNKIVLIGCGNVGMSYVYALLNQKINVHEVVLIDVDEKRIQGEVLDLNHALAFSPSQIVFKVGSYSDCQDATIVVIAAGANQNIGETRMDLINKNAKIFKTIVTKVMENNFDGIFLVATNPLDVMTYLTYKYSKVSSNRVIGTGTTLDTARLRYLLGARLEVNPKNVHAYVIGEHGDSEFIPWSTVSVGALNITNYLSEVELNSIEERVRNSAYEIINLKGSTCYGIGMCMVRITGAILGDENTIMTVSAFDQKRGCYYGYPSVINKNGIRTRTPLTITDSEFEILNNSIEKICTAIVSIEE